MLDPRRPLLLALLALPLFAGCPSMGTMQTARTAGEGNVQIAIEPSVWGVATSEGTVALPNVNMAVRYGVSDSMDVGARFGGSLIQVLGKFRLTDPTAEGDLILSLAPTLGGLFFAGGGAGVGILNLQVPMLAGIPVGDSELTLAPKLIYNGVFGGGGGESASVHAVSIGASVGFAAKIGNFRLVPEVAVSYPLFTMGRVSGDGAGGSISEVAGFGGVMFQVSTAMLFGGD